MSSQQQLPAPNSARLAITSLCNVLRQHGVTCLDAEIVRQAKFDGHVAGPLWRALHDTALVVLAGCPDAPTCQVALARQWEQVSLELSGDQEFPPEGAALVLRQLAAWGAPGEVLKELGPRSAAAAGGGEKAAEWPAAVRSRPLLLALGWLVAAAGLYERRVSELEAGPELRALLPPYPQDSCTSPAVQAAYDAAAQDAQEHVAKLPAGTSAGGAGGRGVGLARGRPAGSDPFGPSAASLAAEGVWGEVEAAAQRAVMLCGRVRSRMVTLQAATDSRCRLSHGLWSRQAAASPSSRPLTPYEMQLCAQPAAMQSHMAALEAATVALLEQQELAAHGALFFEWLGSVLEEERQAQLAGREGGRPGRGGGAKAAQAGRAGAGGPLASLEHLPYVASAAGSRLAEHLGSQLEAAVQAAEPELSAARRRMGVAAPPAPPGLRAPPQHAVSLQQFLAMADQAVSEHPAYDDAGDDSAGAGAGGGGGGGGGGPQLPRVLMAGAGPNCADAAMGLPGDVAAALAAVQAAHTSRRDAGVEEGERFRRLRYCALSRYDFSDGEGGGGGPMAAVLAAAAGLSGPEASVAASTDTKRLLAAVLAAARPLARTRAANKAALLAALQGLPDGYMVAGL